MVKAAEADVVGGAVAGNDPVSAFNQVAFQFGQFLADVAGALFEQRNHLVGHGAALVAVFLDFEPFGEEGFEFVGAAVAYETFVYEAFNAFAHLLVGNVHAEAEFGEVFEERVAPCGTLALGVGGVGGRGYGAGVNR